MWQRNAVLLWGAVVCCALLQDAIGQGAASAMPESVVLKAGTPVWMFTEAKLSSAQAKVDDVVVLKLLRSVRAEGVTVVAAGSEVAGRVTAVLPDLQVGVEPLKVPGGTVGLSGSPLEWKNGRLITVEEPQPPELASHYRLSAGDTAALAGVGLVAAPIVAIASPFMLFDALHHDKRKPGEPEVVPVRHLVMLKTVADVRVETKGLEGLQSRYVGPPVIYVLDYVQQKHRRMYCGNEVFLGDGHLGTTMLRVDPGSYPFRTERKDESVATVAARENARFLVYRDKQGLHTVDLEARPDLLDHLNATSEKTVWAFDTQAIPAEQRVHVDENKAHGGCGLVKVLHSRSAKVAEAK